MPATSSEAVARKKERRNAARNAKRKAAREAVVAFVATVPIGTGRKWRIGPPAPELSKKESREMLAEAVRNTARM